VKRREESQEHQLIAEEVKELKIKKSKIPEDLVLFNNFVNLPLAPLTAKEALNLKDKQPPGHAHLADLYVL